MERLHRDLGLVQVCDEPFLRLVDRVDVVVVVATGVGRRRAAVPVGDRLGEELLPARPDLQRLVGVVEHDRRAQRGEVVVDDRRDEALAGARRDRVVVDLPISVTSSMPAKPSTSAPMPNSAASVTVSRFVHARYSGGCGICTGRGRMGCGSTWSSSPCHSKLVSPCHMRPIMRSGFFDLCVGAVGVDADRRHLLQRRAAARPEVEATVRQHVEHRGALGDAHGMVVVERHAHDAVTDADARRARRHPRQEDLGRAHVRVPLEAMVLDRPDAVEAHLLGEHRLLDAVVDHLTLVGDRRVGHLRFEDHRELHGPNRHTLFYMSRPTPQPPEPPPALPATA